MQVYEEFKRSAYILRLFSEVLKCTYISDYLLRDIHHDIFLCISFHC